VLNQDPVRIPISVAIGCSTTFLQIKEKQTPPSNEQAPCEYTSRIEESTLHHFSKIEQ
jgi:hypothetical protein